MLIVQISDCHIVDEGALVADRIDSAAALGTALSRIESLPVPVDLVVATGDLVNDGRASEYDRFEEIVGVLTAPLVPVPGNHDDRTELRSRFGQVLPAGDPNSPIDHVVDHDGVRLVFLDTQDPGRVGGALRRDQLDWLDTMIADARDRAVIVFQHHPPFRTGIDVMDADPFTGDTEYAAVLARHANVEQVACGHLHRTIVRRFGGTVAATWPSTCVSIDLGLDRPTIRYCDEPVGFAVHHWTPDDGLRSHVVPVDGDRTWVPSWAVSV